MTDQPSTLAELHERPWSDIEGVHVRVEIKEDTRDPLDPTQGDVDDPYEHVVREGTVVGRGNGRGLTYSSEAGELVPDMLGPKIVLDTPEDTFLEVVTDKVGNGLLSFDQEESDG